MATVEFEAKEGFEMRLVATLFAIGAVSACSSPSTMGSYALGQNYAPEQVSRSDRIVSQFENSITTCSHEAEAIWPGVPQNMKDYRAKDAYLDKCVRMGSPDFYSLPGNSTEELRKEVFMGCVEDTDIGAVKCSEILSPEPY